MPKKSQEECPHPDNEITTHRTTTRGNVEIEVECEGCDASISTNVPY